MVWCGEWGVLVFEWCGVVSGVCGWGVGGDPSVSCEVACCRKAEDLGVWGGLVPDPLPESLNLNHAGRECGKGRGLMGVIERVE